MSYEYEIAAEKKAEARLRILAEKMAKECEMLWIRGDGQGGHIFNVISEAFYKRVGLPKVSPPKRSRSISATKKKAVFERDAYRCVKCTSHVNLCVDHIYPWSLGGTEDIQNLQTLCQICNGKKSNKVEEPESE